VKISSAKETVVARNDDGPGPRHVLEPDDIGPVDHRSAGDTVSSSARYSTPKTYRQAGCGQEREPREPAVPPSEIPLSTAAGKYVILV